MQNKIKPIASLVITGATEVITCAPTANDLISRIPGGWVAIAGEHIIAVGSPNEVKSLVDLDVAEIIDASKKIVAPGFVDCHTHLVFGGSRVQEYAARMTMDTAEIHSLGISTGIQATVKMTRAEPFQSLLAGASTRLQRMFRHGTTTVESKSGYGLTVQKEIELLQVNRKLQSIQPVDVVSTFLGAHDFPSHLDRESYIDQLLDEMIPRVAEQGLAEFCDVYCDEGYYTLDEAQRILETGIQYRMRGKIHVDAYANIGGADMAARLGVISADHLNYTTRKGMFKLARAGVVGVVMPALDFAVQHVQPFNARDMMAEGMILALATDLCPGCWVESMQFVMQLACRLYRFSPAEALHAATNGAAQALGLSHDRGSLEPGKLADLQIWNVPTFEDVIYRLGSNAVETVIKRGKVYQN